VCAHRTWRCDLIGARPNAPSLSCPRCPAGACRPAPGKDDRTTMPSRRWSRHPHRPVGAITAERPPGPALPNGMRGASKHSAACGWPAAPPSTSAPTSSARSRPSSSPPLMPRANGCAACPTGPHHHLREPASRPDRSRGSRQDRLAVTRPPPPAAVRRDHRAGRATGSPRDRDLPRPGRRERSRHRRRRPAPGHRRRKPRPPPLRGRLRHTLRCRAHPRRQPATASPAAATGKPTPPSTASLSALCDGISTGASFPPTH
jgi:hypothetical protein